MSWLSLGGEADSEIRLEPDYPVSIPTPPPPPPPRLPSRDLPPIQYPLLPPLPPPPPRPSIEEELRSIREFHRERMRLIEEAFRGIKVKEEKPPPPPPPPPPLKIPWEPIVIGALIYAMLRG